MNRIDVLLTEKGLCKSRSKAASAIREGRVTCNGFPVDKPSLLVGEDAVLNVAQPETQYVSRAGYKLEAALKAFSVSVSGMTVLDLGASTGGFTDCALQNGAAFVYAVDVGSGQLDESLRKDARVCNRENTNARYLKKEDFDRPIDLILTDVSFISQRLLFEAVSDILPIGKPFISLIKPQFEAGKAHIGKGGIVKDPHGTVFASIRKQLAEAGSQVGLQLRSMIPSPIPGGDGNHEYLALWIRV